MIYRRRLIFVLVLLLLSFNSNSYGSITLTKHNLSVSGPGNVKSAQETRICHFCHIPHAARTDNGTVAAPLWNRNDSEQTYTLYQSTTTNFTPKQPTGSSKLCLSCHDGTIALGDTYTKPVDDMKNVFILPGTDAYLGTDLSDEHPISFLYNRTQAQNSELKQSDTFTHVKLDDNGEMQCTSCHTAHDNTYGNFLLNTDRESAICIECHDKIGWAQNIHRLSNKGWNGQGQDPWPRSDYTTVSDNGCGNCHFTHRAPGAQRLLSDPFQENICYPCHNGNVASNIEQIFENRMYTHAPDTAPAGTHDPNEDYQNSTVTEHVVCVDCHNGHVSNKTDSATAPDVNGSVEGVSGIDTNGNSKLFADFTYEICYKCHSDEPNNVSPTASIHVIRESDSWNARDEFDPGNLSFHPIEAVGRSGDVPSLKSPWSTTSILYCHDCHNNDGGGPSGPHGSDNEWMLEENYVVSDPNNNNSNDYALCYKCHDENSILADESFPEHDKHINGEDTSCSVCHDSHGVQNKIQGDSTHLINFDRTVVSTSGGGLYFVDSGSREGACVLVCHGKDHDLNEDGSPNYDYGGSSSD